MCSVYTLLCAFPESCCRSKACNDALDVAFEITNSLLKGMQPLIVLKLKLLRRMGLPQVLGLFALLDGLFGAILLVASLRISYQVLKQLWEERLDTRLEPDIKG